MHELSLHLLDLIENSIRAGATIVSIAVDEQPDEDRLTLRIEDNGPGLPPEAERALDPFYTTKRGKRTGLGLSLLRQTAELAEGSLALGLSPLGGLAVEATMRSGHIDRPPLGDLASTVSSVVCANAGVELRLVLRSGTKRLEINSREIRDGQSSDLATAMETLKRVAAARRETGI